MIVGVLGAGQLGRMLGLAAAPLGIATRFYDDANATSPAACIGPVTAGKFDDFAALDRFASGCDVITYEFENVPVAAAEHLAKSKPVWPPPGALRVAQDRVVEKSFFRDLGAAVPGFAPIDNATDLTRAIEQLDTPAILKTRRLGYDGKGQTTVRTPADAPAALAKLTGEAAGAPTGRPADLILEAFVGFVRELSIIAVRGQDGAMVFYPVTQNWHQHGILAESMAPAAGMLPGVQDAAEAIARRAMESLGYVGVLAIELFEVVNQRLVVNEMAPRVHNSGHWTIEGAVTSQFENHMRAVVGLPLGSTAPIGRSLMLNAIGEMPDAAAVLRVPNAHLHDYGKAARPGRKVGHVTVRREDYEGLLAVLEHLRPIVPFTVEA